MAVFFSLPGPDEGGSDAGLSVVSEALFFGPFLCPLILGIHRDSCSLGLSSFILLGLHDDGENSGVFS